jgi:hypothetical protein
MRPNRLLMLAGAVVVLAGSYLTTTGVAQAHERREVGSYTFVIGFLNEPALVNEPNSLDLRISSAADQSPVEGLENTLTVEVAAEGKALELDVEPRFRTPGAYNGYFMPTATGEYSFHVKGNIEGNAVDETFTSGPETFSSVDPPEGFPNAVDVGESNAAEVSSLAQRVGDLEDESDSNTGVILGIIGIIFGAAGLLVGGLAFTRAKA